MRVPIEAQKQLPTVLVKWYDWLRWLLDRIDSFPKNQRFIFGTRLADRAIGVLELLLRAAYSSEKRAMLEKANREIEVLRWLVRLAKDRKLLTERQYLLCCKSLAECGRMVGGWLKQSTTKEGKGHARASPPV